MFLLPLLLWGLLMDYKQPILSPALYSVASAEHRLLLKLHFVQPSLIAPKVSHAIRIAFFLLTSFRKLKWICIGFYFNHKKHHSRRLGWMVGSQLDYNSVLSYCVRPVLYFRVVTPGVSCSCWRSVWSNNSQKRLSKLTLYLEYLWVICVPEAENESPFSVVFLWQT